MKLETSSELVPCRDFHMSEWLFIITQEFGFIRIWVPIVLNLVFILRLFR